MWGLVWSHRPPIHSPCAAQAFSHQMGFHSPLDPGLHTTQPFFDQILTTVTRQLWSSCGGQGSWLMLTGTHVLDW